MFATVMTTKNVVLYLLASASRRNCLSNIGKKDYELLCNDCIGFEMGIDFGINTYDEDFAVMVLQEELTDRIDELVKDAEVFNIDALKRMYPDGLDRPYNAIIILDRLIYDGAVQEVQNERFGFFKFLGVFDSD